MKNFILYLFFILFLASCGSTQGPATPLKIRIVQGLGTTAIPAGGIYVVGESTDGNSFSKNIVDVNEVFTVPNGQWEFLVVWWDGPNLFEGTTKCDLEGAKLQGNDTTLTFNLNASNCGSTSFFGNAFSSTPYPFTLVNCQSESSYPVSSATLNECNSTPGESLSFQVDLLDHGLDDIYKVNGPSRCFDITSSVANTSLNIPMSHFFPLHVKFFNGPACTGMSSDIVLKNGLENFLPFQKTVVESSLGKLILYTKAPATNPLPVTSGVLNWFDASYVVGITVSAGSVTDWRDKLNATMILSSAVGYYPTQATLPNGKKAISLTSTSYLLGNIPSSILANYNLLTNLSVVVAAKATNPNNAVRMLFGKYDAAISRDFELYQGASDFVTAGSTGSNFTYGNSTLFETAGKNDIFVFTITNSSPKLELFDGYGSLINSNNAPSSGVTNLGNRFKVGDTSSGWNGLIYEIIIYNRALTNAEINSLNTYLKNKWDI